jgi:hypothetical protein
MAAILVAVLGDEPSRDVDREMVKTEQHAIDQGLALRRRMPC